MSRCAAEMCLNWTGDGCICAVFDLEPNVVEEPRYEVIDAGDDVEEASE